MVRASYSHVNADHVVLERHGRVKRRRSRVIAPLRTHPRDAGGFRLLYRDLRRVFHDEMAHAVVAVHEGHRSGLPLDPDVRAHVDRASLDATYVLRRSEEHTSELQS